MNWKNLLAFLSSKKDNNISKTINSPDPEVYFNIAVKKYSENDNIGAMDYFNKTIECP